MHHVLGLSCSDKVDVIIPVYNQALLVDNLLNSICASTNRTQAEIIVIDDSSTEQETVDLLHAYETKGRITLLRNEENRGFTGTVIRGMACHRERDVVLLNSDTVVYGDWLDRMVACAYSAVNIATVNPLTNQYGSHIGCYPGLVKKYDEILEVDGRELNQLCAEYNDRRYVDTHTTVGFCMYVRRQALLSIGGFDAKHFPTGYGEETDFCYRALKFGWRNCVTGDVYVEHLEGQSFGERKRKLKEDMVAAMARLHPDYANLDRRFFRQDPLRSLRRRVDLGRLKRLLGGANQLRVVTHRESCGTASGVALLLDVEKRNVQFYTGLDKASLPNIGTFKLPRDIANLNLALKLLSVDRLVFSKKSACNEFQSMVLGTTYELPIAARITLADPVDGD